MAASVIVTSSSMRVKPAAASRLRMEDLCCMKPIPSKLLRGTFNEAQAERSLVPTGGRKQGTSGLKPRFLAD
jgi:hypothetical protein